MTLEQQIKDRALTLGLDAVGITDASPIAAADIERFELWLRQGRAGQMEYLHRNFEKRTHPAALLPGARSVIVVALNYKPGRPQATPALTSRVSGAVAQYAWYRDYHDLMKPLLFELADFVRTKTGPTDRFKACVDSVPLAERALAVRAGLGFIGANHMLIHPTLGPQVFLGEVVTTVALAPDQPASGTCAGCDRCIQACPTGALQADGSFDARKCISYLTIEHKGDIPSELAAKIGDRIFGCDACVLVCPHQRAAPGRTNRKLALHAEDMRLDLGEVLRLTRESFEERFGGSPIHRAGVEGLQRNARICFENAPKGTGE